MANLMYLNDKYGAIVVVASHPAMIVIAGEKYAAETPVASEGPLLDSQVALEYALSMYEQTQHTRWVVAIAIALQEIEELETGVDPNTLTQMRIDAQEEHELKLDEPDQS